MYLFQEQPLDKYASTVYVCETRHSIKKTALKSSVLMLKDLLTKCWWGLCYLGIHKHMRFYPTENSKVSPVSTREPSLWDLELPSSKCTPTNPYGLIKHWWCFIDPVVCVHSVQVNAPFCASPTNTCIFLLRCPALGNISCITHCISFFLYRACGQFPESPSNFYWRPIRNNTESSQLYWILSSCIPPST